jgi:hypothetical protein
MMNQVTVVVENGIELVEKSEISNLAFMTTVVDGKI